MKATYNDFLAANPNCSKFTSNKDAMAVFDFLNRNDNIIKMIDYCEMGKTALSACVSELEAFVCNLPQSSFDLTDGFTRTVIGRMIKSVLEPFGYRPTVQKAFPKNCNVKYFSSASCYSLTGPATMKIAKYVAEIQM